MARRLPPLLVLLLLVAAVVAPGAGAATRPDARAFAKATLAFDLARGKAVGRADRRGDERRRLGASCLDTLRTAPASRRDDLFTLYFTWVSQGYFVEDEPFFARWVRDLKRIRTGDPALRRARTSLGRQLSLARAVYAQGKRFCGPVTTWAAEGWALRARPAQLDRLDALTARRVPMAGLADAATRLQRSAGTGGALAADALREGIDEEDSRIVKSGDPVVALLAPSS